MTLVLVRVIRTLRLIKLNVFNEYKLFCCKTDEINSELSSDTDRPFKKFTFTFSVDEWRQIQPQNVMYKLNSKDRHTKNSRSYYILPKGIWTPILSEHFWVHTELPCCLSFKRAKVYPNGEVYIYVIGRCSICGSQFEGTISQKPAENAR